MTRATRVAVALFAVAAVAAAARVLTTRSRREPRTAAPQQSDGRRRGAVEHEAEDTYECRCGQRFRVSGRDRHRVYWLESAAPDNPIVSDSCPNCGRSLTAA